MTVDELQEKARALGIDLRMQPTDTLAIVGPLEAVARLLPELNEHKAALVTRLRAARSGQWRKSPDAPYRCASCWRWFAEDALTAVPEAVGRGFRCQGCLRRGSAGPDHELY